MNARRTVLASMLAAAALTLAGCNHESKATASRESAGTVAFSNTTCPFSGKPVNPKFSSSYEGKTVGFCCSGCKAKFDGMAVNEKAVTVAQMH